MLNGTNPTYLYALAFALSGDQWSVTDVKTDDPPDAPAIGVFRFPKETWQRLICVPEATDILPEHINFPNIQCIVAAILAGKSAHSLKRLITDRELSAIDLFLANLFADDGAFGSTATVLILQAERNNKMQSANSVIRVIYPDTAVRTAFFKRNASIFNVDGSASIEQALAMCVTKMNAGFAEVRKMAGEAFERLQGRKSIPLREPDAWFRQRYLVLKDAVAPLPSGADPIRQVERFHAIFGSEAVTFPWLDTMRVTGLSTRQSAGHEAVDILSSAQATKTEELHRLQVHFRLATEDPVGHVITITDNQGRRFCCVLPGDQEKRVFQLEIDVEREGDYYAFIRVATYLSPKNDGITGQVASAWEQMRARDPIAAAQRLEDSGAVAELEIAFQMGEDFLADKLREPLAAVVATLMLLKGNRFDLMHGWARNVGNWFRWIPDGVVLWIEQYRRMAGGRSLDPDLMRWLVRELSCRSLPFTADGFGLAADIATDIARGRLKTDRATRDAAKALVARIERASPYFRDTGLFCTFAGWPEDWDPIATLGPPVASQS